MGRHGHGARCCRLTRDSGVHRGKRHGLSREGTAKQSGSGRHDSTWTPHTVMALAQDSHLVPFDGIGVASADRPPFRVDDTQYDELYSIVEGGVWMRALRYNARAFSTWGDDARRLCMIHFVGAGSGAVDLITVRGDRLLRRADVVIWAGSLVNPGLLDVCRPTVELHDSSRMTLEEVLEVMERANGEGLDVVRLHTGDPCLYGAIQEQRDALRARGIPFEVVPGVSSFCGAAAALQQELTLPGVSQSVIITRVAGRTPVPEAERLTSLATHGSTLVLFLSAGLLDELAHQLVEAGRSPEEPAAIVYKATWPDELVVRCTVGTLAQEGARHGIASTALVVVGKVLDGGYDRSKLYDPAFATAFRPATGLQSSEDDVPHTSHAR